MPTPDTDLPLLTLQTVLMRDIYMTDPPWPVMSRRHLHCTLVEPCPETPSFPFVYTMFTLSLN